MDDVQDVEATLRGVSDQFFLAVQALIQLESRKRATAPVNDGFVALSRDVSAAAAEVLRIAVDQERLAEAVTASPIQAELEPIDAVAPTGSLASILDEWRAVERELAGMPPGSPQAALLSQRFEDLRRRYAAALARLRSTDGITSR